MPHPTQGISMLVRPFSTLDETSVIALWEACQLIRSTNDPHADIQRKMQVNPELFLVGTQNDRIVATVMAGYDGHRGWINYLAVAPDLRKIGLARLLLNEVERRLKVLGCPKINLQVRCSNIEAIHFYEQIGFVEDEVVSFGKRLSHDFPAMQ